jgi:hypothetical protein
MQWCKAATIEGKVARGRDDRIGNLNRERLRELAAKDAAARTSASAAAAGASNSKHSSSTAHPSEASINSSSSSTSKEAPAHEQFPCYHCAAEASSSNADTAECSGSQQAAAGLYGALPVPWSDPFMMRRLLWDLLGKLKPTAQAWFRQYGMCPHDSTPINWSMVVLSLARHIWAPPGPWGAYSLEQMNLLLPANVRNSRARRGDSYRFQRATFARELNLRFAQQGVDGQVAALLSMQALLALDPHSARVQPKPELLYFTPAGFHVSVMKTLTDALVAWPSVLSAEPSQPGEQEGAGSAQQDMPGLQRQTKRQQQQQQQDELRYEQQQQQDELQYEQQQQGSSCNQPLVQNIPFWSQAALPAWYMWWHIGLLAYHEQQHQQQQHCKTVADGLQPEAAGSCSSVGTACCSDVQVQDLYSSTDAR